MKSLSKGEEQLVIASQNWFCKKPCTIEECHTFTKKTGRFPFEETTVFFEETTVFLEETIVFFEEPAPLVLYFYVPAGFWILLSKQLFMQDL